LNEYHEAQQLIVTCQSKLKELEEEEMKLSSNRICIQNDDRRGHHKSILREANKQHGYSSYAGKKMEWVLQYHLILTFYHQRNFQKADEVSHYYFFFMNKLSKLCQCNFFLF
jgi:hypothetical protein